MVPPNTIMAAVGCMICENLPPSSSSPAMIPPTARTIPPSVAMSNELLLLLPRDFAWGRSTDCYIVHVEQPTQDGPSELDDAVQHLRCTFSYDHFFPVQKG